MQSHKNQHKVLMRLRRLMRCLHPEYFTSSSFKGNWDLPSLQPGLQITIEADKSLTFDGIFRKNVSTILHTLGIHKENTNGTCCRCCFCAVLCVIPVKWFHISPNSPFLFSQNNLHTACHTQYTLSWTIKMVFW
jgi:hypothetical protein